MVQVTGYRGNQNIKRSNIQHKFTEEQIKEYLKCAKDPIYFIENYVKVVHLDKGLVPMTLYPYQKQIIIQSVKNKRVISKIPRQAGKSTAIAAFALYQVLFKQNYNVLIAANKGKTAMEIMKKVQTAFEWLPEWLQQGIAPGGWNKSTIELENGSRVMAVGTSSDSARGYSFNCVILDEFAFLKKSVADEFFTSIYPTISSGETTKLIIISTPKGLNHFYKIWTEAVEKKNDYFPIEINWWDVPGRGEEFKKDQIRNFGLEKWRQEFECAFLGSSSTLIDASILTTLPVINPIDKINDIQIYEKPNEHHKYFISVDGSEGKGLDYNAFVVVDITQQPFKVVATYRNKYIEPLLMPDVLYHAGKMYNDAFILVETRAIGTQVPDALFHEKEYYNVLGTKSAGRAGQKLTSYSKDARGLATSTVTKSIGCSTFKFLLENEQFIINDFDIIEEISNFVLKRNTYKADDGHHDDLVMCLVNFSWATTQAYFKHISDIDIKGVLEEKQNEMKTNFLPFFMPNDNNMLESSEADDDGWNHWFYSTPPQEQ